MSARRLAEHLPPDRGGIVSRRLGSTPTWLVRYGVTVPATEVQARLGVIFGMDLVHVGQLLREELLKAGVDAAKLEGCCAFLSYASPVVGAVACRDYSCQGSMQLRLDNDVPPMRTCPSIGNAACLEM